MGTASLLIAFPPIAWAQSAPNSTAASPICTDRPTKSYAPCTVDPGHWQIETDLVNITHQRAAGVTTDTYLVTNPTLKYGLLKTVDIEANIAPYEVVTTQVAGGETTTLGGLGDLYLRLKYEPFASKDGRTALAFIPYLKVPIARLGLGNGAVEGGVVATFTYKLTEKLTVLSQPEVDDFKDSADAGHHVAASQILNISYNLPYNLQASAEIWASWDFDPSGLGRQQSADIALQWGVTPNFQVDGGVNFGLNSQTPGFQPYIGLSRRF